MVEWGPVAYNKQIELYIKNKDYMKALSLAQEFVEKYPGDMIANFMMGKACFWAKELEMGLKFARKAFNLSSKKDDLIMCGILLASIYFQAKRYKDGYSLLKSLDAKDKEDVEKLMLLMSIALEDVDAIEEHISILYEINSRTIIDILY